MVVTPSGRSLLPNAFVPGSGAGTCGFRPQQGTRLARGRAGAPMFIFVGHPSYRDQ